MRFVTTFLFACLIAEPQWAQQFEAADVHPSTATALPAVEPFNKAAFSPHRMKGGAVQNGLYTVRTATMADLIGLAWNLDAEAVAGGPTWLNSDRFDLQARVAPGTEAAQARVMLQALLAERFGLRVRQETQPRVAWVLTAAKRHPLTAAHEGGAPGCRPVKESKTPSWNCRSVNMQAFAALLPAIGSSALGAVVDNTALEGAWDFTLYWGAADAGPGSLFAALEDQLGLKLERRTVPLPAIVVESVNRRPTPNAPGTEKSFPARPTEFEVADVKPSLAHAPEGGGILPGGRVDMRGNTLKDLIKFAYNIDDNDDDTLAEDPKWLDTDRFDIVAKAFTDHAPTAENIDIDALRPMMKALLAERFQLRVHSETKPGPVLVLTAAKPHLAQAAPASQSFCRKTLGTPPLSVAVECRNTTMADFAEQLRDLAGSYAPHPVVDGTGLPGGYDFNLAFSPRKATRTTKDSALADPTGALTLAEALEKQLGLKLKQEKRPMPALIVDHVERRPTQN